MTLAKRAKKGMGCRVIPICNQKGGVTYGKLQIMKSNPLDY